MGKALDKAGGGLHELCVARGTRLCCLFRIWILLCPALPPYHLIILASLGTGDRGSTKPADCYWTFLWLPKTGIYMGV
jgi:hypothetical protein